MPAPPSIHRPAPGEARSISCRETGWELHLGSSDLLVVGGLPGAGKTFLLDRLGPASALLSTEAELIRTHGKHLDWRLVDFNAALFRAVVRAEAELARGNPVVLEAVGMKPALRQDACSLAHRQGSRAHFLWLSVPADQARLGQAERGRRVPEEIWRRYLQESASFPVEHDPDSLVETDGWDSVTVVDRAAADELHAIVFAKN